MKLKAKDHKVIGVGIIDRGLYILKAQALLQQEHVLMAVTEQKTLWEEWHQRFGHIGIMGLQKLQTGNLVTRFKVDKTSIPP